MHRLYPDGGGVIVTCPKTACEQYRPNCQNTMHRLYPDGGGPDSELFDGTIFDSFLVAVLTDSLLPGCYPDQSAGRVRNATLPPQTFPSPPMRSQGLLRRWRRRVALPEPAETVSTLLRSRSLTPARCLDCNARRNSRGGPSKPFPGKVPPRS